MHVLRFEAAERLRAQAHASARGVAQRPPVQLEASSGLDDEAAQVAWASFVPFLAHPVMASRAQEAMHLIDGVARGPVTSGAAR